MIEENKTQEKKSIRFLSRRNLVKEMYQLENSRVLTVKT